MRGRIALVALALTAACGAPDKPLDLGFKEVPSDVVLGAQSTPTPSAGPVAVPVPPPPSVVTLPPPPYTVPVSAVAPSPPPPLPSPAACPPVDPLAAPAVDARNGRVREEVLRGLGSGRFAPTRIGEERVYRIRLPEQTLLLSFARNGRSFTLMVTRAGYRDPERLFGAVLAYRRGSTTSLEGPADVPVPDPRRGSDS